MPPGILAAAPLDGVDGADDVGVVGADDDDDSADFVAPFLRPEGPAAAFTIAPAQCVCLCQIKCYVSTWILTGTPLGIDDSIHAHVPKNEVKADGKHTRNLDVLSV